MDVERANLLHAGFENGKCGLPSPGSEELNNAGRSDEVERQLAVVEEDLQLSKKREADALANLDKLKVHYEAELRDWKARLEHVERAGSADESGLESRMKKLERDLLYSKRDRDTQLAKVQEFERERLELAEERDSLIRQVEGFTGVRERTRQVSDLDAEVETLVKERDILKRDRQRKIDKLIEVQTRLSAAECQCRSLREERETLSSKMQILRNKVDGTEGLLKKEEQERKMILEELENVRKELEAVRELNAEELKKERDGLVLKRQESEKKMMEIAGEHADIKTRLNDALNHLEILKCRVKEGTVPREEIVEAEQKLHDVTQRCDENSAALRCLSGKLAVTECENSRLELVVDELESEKLCQWSELSKVQEKLQDVEGELEATSKNYEQSCCALRILSGQVSETEKENKRLVLVVEDLERERLHQYTEIATLTDHLKYVGTELISVRAVNARLGSAHLDQLEKENSALKLKLREKETAKAKSKTATEGKLNVKKPSKGALKENKHLASVVKELERERDEQYAEIAALTDRLKCVGQEVLGLRFAYARLDKANVDKLEKENAELKGSLAERVDQLDRVQCERNMLHGVNMSNGSLVTASRKMQAQFRDEKRALITENTAMRDQVDELKSVNQEKGEEIQSLTGKLDSTEKELGSLKGVNLSTFSLLEAARKQQMHYKLEAANWMETAKKVEAALGDVRNTVSQKQEQIDAIQGNFEKLESELSTLQGVVSVNWSLLGASKTQKSALKSKNAELKERVEELEERMEVAKKEAIEKLSVKSVKLTTTQGLVDDLKTKLAKEKRRVTNLDKRKKELEQEHKTMASVVKSLKKSKATPTLIDSHTSAFAFAAVILLYFFYCVVSPFRGQ